MLLSRLRRSHMHVVIARRGALPTRQRIIGTASDHGTGQKRKGQCAQHTDHTKPPLSFGMISMHVSSNQSAVCTGDRYLTNLLQAAKSHVIICTHPTREINRCASICYHASSSQLCHLSPPLRKGRCVNSFSERIKGTRIGHSLLLTWTSAYAYSTALFLT